MITYGYLRMIFIAIQHFSTTTEINALSKNNWSLSEQGVIHDCVNAFSLRYYTIYISIALALQQ